jgi:phenylalanyl-tRNA synthetase beta chain
MQVPLGWLNEFIAHKFSQQELDIILTSIGLESEKFTPEPLNFNRVFVGKVTGREKSPDSRGFIYTVEVGNAAPGGMVKIFSTIPDIETGVKYPVALAGGHVGALEITERPYEGFTSQGKFCAATELGLTKLEFVEHKDGTVDWVDGLEDADGRALSIFPDLHEFAPGTDLAEWLLGDPAVSIELTSNRADCHSMIGVAREMRVVTGGDLVVPPLDENFEETSGETDDIHIFIDDPKGCMLYAGLLIDNIRVAPSPMWLAKKLFSVGLRPISNLVDITNLVLYELGQPLHAFDYSHLRDKTIFVRRAREGETMATIDGIVRKLIPSDLVIADKENPVAIAGVMGGFLSEVTGKTKQILIESAWFDPVSIRRTSRRLALRTDAAIRFERGVDPNGIVRAIYRVAHLVRELKCGTPVGKIAVCRAREEKEIVISLDETKIASVLGTDIPTGQIELILEGLGFTLDGMGPTWKVHVPSFRRDIFIVEDLIEEIARHVGYNNLPEEFPRPHMHTGLIDDEIRIRREIKEILSRIGLWELNSFPLGTEKNVARPNPFIPSAQPAVILNPISDDAAILRMSLVPGIIETFVKNLRRGSTMHDVFEVGKVYWKDEKDFHEAREVILAVLGERGGKKKERTREKGFLKLKGYVEAFLRMLDIANYDIISDPSVGSGMMRHTVVRDGATVGYLEAVLEDSLGGETFERPIFTAIFPWSFVKKAFIDAGALKSFRQVPSFPAADRDLAFVLDESVAFRKMAEAVREAGGVYLESLSVFDVYRGKQIGENMKNLAVNLRFRHPERTLTDAEVDGWMADVVELVKKRTGGKIRDW